MEEYNHVVSEGTWTKDPTAYNLEAHIGKIKIWTGYFNEHQGCKVVRDPFIRLGRICYYATLTEVQSWFREVQNRFERVPPASAVSIFLYYFVACQAHPVLRFIHVSVIALIWCAKLVYSVKMANCFNTLDKKRNSSLR